MARTFFCTECGTPLAEGALFCPECGTKAEFPEEAFRADAEPAPALSQQPQAVKSPAPVQPAAIHSPQPDRTEEPEPKKRGSIVGRIIAAVAFLGVIAACLLFVLNEGTKDAYTDEAGDIKINAIAVDQSYENDEDSSLQMVYVCYTLTANQSNYDVDSKYTEMTIADTNTYSSDNFASSAAAGKYMANYYYSSIIEEVYVGDSINVIATFKVPEGDLAPGRKLRFADSQISDMSGICMYTDNIQYFEDEEALAASIDWEGYTREKTAREKADSETVKFVKSCINGYYWSFYVNYTSYELEFYAPDEFVLRTSLGSNNGGTYSVRNGYIFCTYPAGTTVEIPYEIVDGDVQLDCVEAFSVF